VSQTERPDLDPQIDALYGLPLAEFTAERDALAKRLRAEKRRDDADAVKKLAKPSAAAWLVNQLARSGELGDLLEAGEALRRAHEAALAGGGAGALAGAADAERRAVGRLVERARALGGDDGPPSEATLARVGETLHAVASDDDARQLVERGRLVKERQAVGLGPMAAFAVGAPAATGASERPPARERRAEPAPEPPPKRDAAAERMHARRVAAAEKALEEARRDAEAAQAAYAAREDEHRRAKADREAAEEERERARQAVRRAEDAVDAARAGEAEARVAEREERRKRDAAGAALMAAEDELRRLEDDGDGEGGRR
jgi:hypothetical protein